MLIYSTALGEDFGFGSREESFYVFAVADDDHDGDGDGGDKERPEPTEGPCGYKGDTEC